MSRIASASLPERLRLALAAAILVAAVPAARGEEAGLALPRLTAGAADLVASAPRRPEPCPGQGAGFVRLPGSGTCIRLSGRATAGLAVQAGRGGAAARPVAGGRVALDSRTDTELGPVRTYIRVGAGQR